MNTDLIRHEGEILSFTEQRCRVKISTRPACSSCHGRGKCPVPDMSEQVIECVPLGRKFRRGEKVWVVMEERMGWKSILYAFFLPFLVLMASFLLLVIAGVEDKYAGLLALVSLASYYLVLWKYNERLTRDFVFRLVKFDKGGHS